MQQQMRGWDNSDPWIFSLLSHKFFDQCFLHQSSRKSEKNVFCLDCCTTICPLCLPSHRSHRLLQVRRYVYQDVIRLDDIDGLFDCGFVQVNRIEKSLELTKPAKTLIFDDTVQSYTTNSAKVIFLNQRPQTRAFKGSASVCCVCDRSLQRLYHFCSLACKVEYLVQYDGCITTTTGYAHAYDYSRTSDFDCTQSEVLDGSQMTPSSVLDAGLLPRASPGSSGSRDAGCMTAGCLATSETVWRKKWTRTIVVELNDGNTPRRRKGIPHRSPLH